MLEIIIYQDEYTTKLCFYIFWDWFLPNPNRFSIHQHWKPFEVHNSHWWQSSKTHLSSLCVKKTRTYRGLRFKGHDVQWYFATPEFLRFHFYQSVFGRHDLHLHAVGQHRAKRREYFHRAGAVHHLVFGGFVRVLKVQVFLSPVGP